MKRQLSMAAWAGVMVGSLFVFGTKVAEAAPPSAETENGPAAPSSNDRDQSTDRPRWSPGNRTTATLPGEVTPSDVTVDEVQIDDGVYGRFAGDLEFSFQLGAELDLARFAPRTALVGTAHYFSTAGIYASYRDSLRTELRDGELRIVSFGVDIRPLFLARWKDDLERGPEFFDLMLDSISLRLGAYWAEPDGDVFGKQRGFEASLGFGVPLSGASQGLWLRARGQLRWPEQDSPEPSILLTLGFHFATLSPWLREDPLEPVE